MTFSVRPYSDGDQRAIRALHDQTPPASSPPTDEPQRWHEELDDIEQHYLAFWVATDEAEQIVGMTGLERLDWTVPAFVDRSARTARLMRMRVAPDWQRQGIGRLLLGAAIEWARDGAYDAIVLETTPQQVAAVRLYEHVGFAEIGRSMVGRYELVWFRRNIRA